MQSVAELEGKLLLLRWRDCEPALTLSNGLEKFRSCSRSHTTSSTPPDLATAESRLFDSLTFSDPNKNEDEDYRDRLVHFHWIEMKGLLMLS